MNTPIPLALSVHQQHEQDIQAFCVKAKAEHPKLLTEQDHREMLGRAAKNIRKLLRMHWPKEQFTVNSSRFSQGNSITVSWLTFLPTPIPQDVGDLLRPFETIDSDQREQLTLTELAKIRGFQEAFGRTRFLHVNPATPKPKDWEQRAEKERLLLEKAVSTRKKTNKTDKSSTNSGSLDDTGEASALHAEAPRANEPRKRKGMRL